MREMEAAKYIKKLGLEKGFNAVDRIFGDEEIEMLTEEELEVTATQIIVSYLQKYNFNYLVTLYILRYDGTAQIFFNDVEGIKGSAKTPLEEIKQYAKMFSAKEDYVLMVETSPNKFSLVAHR